MLAWLASIEGGVAPDVGLPHGSTASLMLLAGVVVLLLAFWIDERLGEPGLSIHPVVWMGHYLKACGRVTSRLAPGPAFALGALAWCTGAALTAFLAWALQAAVVFHVAEVLRNVAEDEGDAAQAALAAMLVLLMAAVLKCMFSWRMLREETGAVELALQQSLAAGRERLSWLVSRDTTHLTENQVRESAIESLAENLNDSFAAPLFWFLLFGLPGAAVYRFANTADAMWGYRGTYRGRHWEWAGKWAARADDVLSWLPARLTALLLLQGRGIALSLLRREAGKTPSPNSGWPMAAMALVLGVALGKPGVYLLNPDGRAAAPEDVPLAQAQASRAVLMMVLLSSLILLAASVVLAT